MKKIKSGIAEVGDNTMQSEQKHNAAIEIYKPNHVLYRRLLAGAAVISIISAFIPQENPLFSILIGIGSGGIASVIVAWLIDISTCKQNNEKIATTRRIVFSQLTSSIESGIQIFIMQSFQLEAMTDFECKKSWIEWIADDYSAVKDHPEELKRFCAQCSTLANNIREQASIINAQTVTLLDSGVIGEDEKLELSAILNVCDLFHIERVNLGISNELADRCLRNYRILQAIFEKIPIVSEINNKQIGSLVFQKIGKDTLKKVYKDEV